VLRRLFKVINFLSALIHICGVLRIFLSCVATECVKYFYFIVSVLCSMLCVFRVRVYYLLMWCPFFMFMCFYVLFIHRCVGCVIYYSFIYLLFIYLFIVNFIQSFF
jgi:hypothetical protein